MAANDFSTDPNSIVTVDVSTIQAPTPVNYQQTGVLVSIGGTTLSVNGEQYLSQASDLTQYLVAPHTVTSASWSSGTVTVNLPPSSLNHANGDVVPMVLAGFTPDGYNGAVTATVTSTSSFTFPLASNPGAETVPGTVQPLAAVELYAMVKTFFGQGKVVGVSVLELGYNASVAASVAQLGTWVTNNPRIYYGFLLPRAFSTSGANETALKGVLNSHANPNDMTYFWATVSTTTYDDYDATYKSLLKFIEAPTVLPQGTEFSAAAMFYQAMQFKPSSTNRVAPMAFKYVYGVTPYPTKGNGPLLTALKANFTNYVATGAEGGISNTLVYQGVNADGTDYFNWWWTIDNTSIQLNLNASNAIINGSNDPLAPLYYDQPGINTLQGVAQNTMSGQSQKGMVNGPIKLTTLDGPGLTNAINSGTFAGQCDINAVPFLDYSLANPGDYKIGEYDGISVLFIPARGFVHVLINLVASELVTV